MSIQIDSRFVSVNLYNICVFTNQSNSPVLIFWLVLTLLQLYIVSIWISISWLFECQYFCIARLQTICDSLITNVGKFMSGLYQAMHKHKTLDILNTFGIVCSAANHVVYVKTFKMCLPIFQFISYYLHLDIVCTPPFNFFITNRNSRNWFNLRIWRSLILQMKGVLAAQTNWPLRY